MTKTAALFSTLALLGAGMASAQQRVSDGTVAAAINPNAVLEMQSNNKGMLLPRVALTATTNAAPLSAHVAGMYVYNTATTGDVTPGNYYNDGTKWYRVSMSLSGTTNPTGTAPVNTIYTNTATGNVYSYTGTTWVDLTNPPTKVTTGVLGAGADIVIGSLYHHTGSYITLPPGKWLVSAYMILSKGAFTAANETWWVRSTFADNTTSTTASPDVATGKLISGTLTGYCKYGIVSGSVVITNSTTADKTYWYMACAPAWGAQNATDTLSQFGGSYWVENMISAIQIVQ